LDTLERCCPNLSSVALRQICCGTKNLPRLKSLLRRCPGIRRLCLEWSIRNVEWHGELGFIIDCLADVQVLALKGRHTLVSRDLLRLASHHCNLQALSLSEWYGPDQWRVQPEAIAALLQHCPRLVALRLRNINVGLRASAVPVCLALRHVELCDIDGDLTGFVSALAVAAGATLRYLGLEACRVRDSALKAVATHCDALLQLDLTNALSLTDAGLWYLHRQVATTTNTAIIPGTIYPCPSLAKLNITLDSEVGDRVILSPFSSAAIASLVSARPALKINDMDERTPLHCFEELVHLVDHDS